MNTSLSLSGSSTISGGGGLLLPSLLRTSTRSLTLTGLRGRRDLLLRTVLSVTTDSPPRYVDTASLWEAAGAMLRHV